MSKRIFSNEQINELLKNKNVARCSEKSITYHKDFKIEAVRLYQDEGMSASQIFKEAGFNLDVIGRKTPKNCLRDWRKIFKTKGAQGLSVEQRGSTKKGGRPMFKGLTDAQIIEKLKTQILYLKAENDFLAKLRAGKRK